jgi:hypothetical protein
MPPGWLGSYDEKVDVWAIGVLVRGLCLRGGAAPSGAPAVPRPCAGDAPSSAAAQW